MNRQALSCVLVVALASLAGCGDDVSTRTVPDVSSADDAGDAWPDVADVAVVDAADADVATDADTDTTSRPSLNDGWASRDASGADAACATIPCPVEPPRSSSEDDCPSGVFEGGEWFEDGRGICAPMPPQGVSLDACPGGELAAQDLFEGGGVCRPELPRMEESTCPDGWVVETTPPSELWRSAMYCRPLVPDAPCDEGYGVPGEAECVPFAACPEGRWLGLEELRTWAPGYEGVLRYVDPAASAPGDGSAASPYPAVDDALASARDGDVIVLAPGVYPDIVVGRDVAFVGACEARTQVYALLTTAGSDVLAARIRFDGPAHYAVRVGVPADDPMGCDGEADASLTLRDVSVRGGDDDVGWFEPPERGSATVRVCSGSRVSIEDARLRSDHASTVVTESRATAELHRVDLSNASSHGIYALSHTNSVVARDVLSIESGSSALVFRPGATATIERVAIARSGGVGVLMADDDDVLAPATVSLTDAWIDGQPQADDDRSMLRGIQAEMPVVLSVERAYIGGSDEEGILWEDDPGFTSLGLAHDVTLRDVVVFDTRDVGVDLDAPTRLVAERLWVGTSVPSGVRLAPTVHPDAIVSDVILRDVAVVDVSREEERLAEALAIGGQVMVEGQRLELAAWTEIALYSYDAAYTDGVGTRRYAPTIALTDVLAVDDPQAEEVDAYTFYIDEGTDLTLHRAVVREGARRAIDVRDDSTARLQDVVVLGRTNGGQNQSGGIAVVGGGTLAAERMVVMGVHVRGILQLARDGATSPTTTATLTDVDLVDVRADPATGLSGFGLDFGPATGALVQRLRIDGCHTAGMTLGSGSRDTDAISLIGRDVIVRNCSANDIGADGGGIFVGPGATLDLRHALLERNDYGGVAVFGHDGTRPARATLSDVVIAGHEGSERTGSAGVGAAAGLGGVMEAERVDVVGNHTFGVAAIGEGAEPSVVRGTDLRVLQTQFQRCAVGEDGVPPCPATQAFGSGLVAAYGATLELERIESSRNAFVGLQVVSGGRARITDGLLADNVIGLNVFEAELDINRDLERVVRRGNDIDEEWASVPFPSLTDLLDF